MAYFEDVKLGDAYEVPKAAQFEKDMMEAFAKTYRLTLPVYDGRQAAHPWHVAAMWMQSVMTNAEFRRLEDDGPPPGPSPGFLDLRWPNPVFAGDKIVYDGKVIEKIELRSRPTLGIIRQRSNGINQDGVLVYSFIGQALYVRRPKE